ncbi:MAG: sugar transferase [Firmicutes bacterium HGW-Firmicutes-7]|nr:MAG: sugar transferase [Firmicutes bacterium HGW-Firmicutes-7]
MIRWRKRIRRMSYLITDLICLILSFMITQHIYKPIFDRRITLSSLEQTGLILLLTVVFISVFIATSLYEIIMEEDSVFSIRVLSRVVISYVIAVLIMSAIMFLMKISLSRLFFGLLVIDYFITALIGKHMVKEFQCSDLNGTSHCKNILVIGQSLKGKAYIEQIKKYGYLNLNIIGYVHIKEPNNYMGIQHLGGIEDLEEITKLYVIDEIAVAKPLTYDERLADIINRCQEMGITITMILETNNYDTTKAQVAMVGNIPVLKFHTVSLNENQILGKRIIDVYGAMFGMVFFIIAYIVIGPLIKLETPGPVIFKQKRVGKNGRVFEILKFRSMGVNAETQKEALLVSNEMSGYMFKMTNDPRITNTGKFIRKTSIDELPQFWNVLKGDMSLVGTRPPTIDEVKQYEAHHHRRISITPGITGNWQVSGRSDIEDFEQVVSLDTDYISNWTIWTDIKILLKTVFVVFAGKGSK